MGIKLKRETLFSLFDKKTNLFYKLVACENDWNALEISGIQMHSYKHGIKKTIKKMVNTLKPKGIVLDCCCGLGYLAILTAKRKSVRKVYSFEKDPNVIFLAKKNPFSKELFENKKIILKNEDIFEAIKKFRDKMFDCIFHDPPSIKIAEYLYSREFYQQLYRVLKPHGRILHYIGTPGKYLSKYFRGITKRLYDVGFRKVIKKPEVMGLLIIK